MGPARRRRPRATRTSVTRATPDTRTRIIGASGALRLRGFFPGEEGRVAAWWRAGYHRPRGGASAAERRRARGAGLALRSALEPADLLLEPLLLLLEALDLLLHPAHVRRDSGSGADGWLRECRSHPDAQREDLGTPEHGELDLVAGARGAHLCRQRVGGVRLLALDGEDAVPHLDPGGVGRAGRNHPRDQHTERFGRGARRAAELNPEVAPAHAAIDLQLLRHPRDLVHRKRDEHAVRIGDRIVSPVQPDARSLVGGARHGAPDDHGDPVALFVEHGPARRARVTGRIDLEDLARARVVHSLAPP